MINKKLPNNFKCEKGRGIDYFYDETWITNGKFAAKKEIIKDSYLYCHNPKNLDMPDINRVVPEKLGNIILIKTRKLYETGETYARIFIDSQNNEYFFDDKYIDFFKIENLFTEGENNVATNEDISFILMPMRKPMD